MIASIAAVHHATVHFICSYTSKSTGVVSLGHDLGLLLTSALKVHRVVVFLVVAVHLLIFIKAYKLGQIASFVSNFLLIVVKIHHVLELTVLLRLILAYLEVLVLLLLHTTVAAIVVVHSVLRAILLLHLTVLDPLLRDGCWLKVILLIHLLIVLLV